MFILIYIQKESNGARTEKSKTIICLTTVSAGFSMREPPRYPGRSEPKLKNLQLFLTSLLFSELVLRGTEGLPAP